MGCPAHLVPEGVRPNSASYPAALPDVVAVGALGPDGGLATFTPHPAPWIRLLAPGTGLTGAYLRGMVTIEHKDRDGRVLDSRQVRFRGQAVWQGCSFAAGVVSGAIAAGTIPGHRPARQVLEELLQLDQLLLGAASVYAPMTRPAAGPRMNPRCRTIEPRRPAYARGCGAR